MMHFSNKKNPLLLNVLVKFALVQYGPPRSGSTLVYNIMREIFPGRKIFKVHSHRKMCRVLPVVATYRHPFDSIASSLLRYGVEKPSLEDIERQVRIFNESNLKELSKFIERPNVLPLKYEEFKNDYNVIFDAFENFFDMEIDPERRKSLEGKFGIQNIKAMTDNMGKFNEMDKETLLHGKHISKFQGESYYKDFFTSSQLDRLKTEYAQVLDDLGYDA